MNVPTQTEVFSKHPQRKTQKVQIKEHLLKLKCGYFFQYLDLSVY